MNEEEKQAVKDFEDLLKKHFEETSVTSCNFLDGIEIDEQVIKSMETTLNLIDKQQKEIKILKDNLVEERAFCKSTLETLKNCVDKDYLYKMISFKDGEIEKLKEAYQILKDDIEGHRIAYVDTPEFEEKYISKDKIKEKIEEITSYAYTSTEERDCQDYAIQVLKELLGE